MPVRFILNGSTVEDAVASPTRTLLEYLREERHLTGTKEGCAEGDCGACTVLVRRGPEAAEAVNSCLVMLGQIDGAEITTVEGLAADDGTLNVVQAALVATDGSQCGYCTPGFVMAIEGLRRSGGSPDDETIHDALAGNLCRCTGYRPIVDATRAACAERPTMPSAAALPDSESAHDTNGQKFFAPSNLADLVALRAAYPKAYLLAGGTDLGLLVSKERHRFAETISTRRVAELRQIEDTEDSIRFGAAVTYTEALPLLDAAYPSFGTLIRRIGSRQIRNMGTIGGNIGNASPIGDMPPCLIVLDATLVLAGPNGERRLALEDYFLDYRKTALAPDEVIATVVVPKPAENEAFRVYKVSKRYDQDISSVVGAFRLSIEDGVVTGARVAFGGMAATPKRAAACEAALTGVPWTEASAESAAAEIAQDFAPIDDHRASAGYRSRVAGNLLLRLWRDTAEGVDEPLQVVAL